jgi:uncharacterized membrane-anchored protein
MAFVRRSLYWLVVALQVMVVLVFVGAKEYTLRGGEEIVLTTVPVDPRDLFRGDYVVLRYDISTVAGRFAVGDTVYLRLIESDSAWRPQYASKESPGPDETFIRGRVVRQVESRLGVPQIVPQVEVEYGIESYFVPEGTGRAIEQQRGKLRVRVVVDRSGNAVIKDLLMDQP